jgi:hypothetical protein
MDHWLDSLLVLAVGGVLGLLARRFLPDADRHRVGVLALGLGAAVIALSITAALAFG